jgi:hypothetical protein
LGLSQISRTELIVFRLEIVPRGKTRFDRIGKKPGAHFIDFYETVPGNAGGGAFPASFSFWKDMRLAASLTRTVLFELLLS